MNDAPKPRHAHLCAFDGCGTICIEMFCWKHRAPPPAGEWQIAQQVRADIEAERTDADTADG